MDLNRVIPYKNYIIVAFLLILSIITLYIRILPFFGIGSGDPINYVGMDDPLYKLREIEQTIANFPAYAWYDPMSYFPFGASIHWGPLSTLIASFMCIVAGASTRPEIIKVALFMPPIFAALMIPVIYYLVHRLFDWKVGIIAALFVSVVSGQYFARSMYGYLDHHMLEVFFGTFFCLCFILSLMYIKPRGHALKKKPDESYTMWISRERTAFAYGILTGFSFLLGLFVMPTMILFALIVGMYTFVQMLINHFRQDDNWYLVFTNTTVFLVPMIGFFAIGWDSILMIAQRYGSSFLGGFSLAAYTPAQPIAYLFLIVATFFFYHLVSWRVNNTNIKYIYYMIGIAIAVVVALFVFLPTIPTLFISGTFEFFGQTAYASTVQEARSWTNTDAYAVFGLGLFLMILGFVVLLYKIATEKRDEFVFAFFWFLLVIVATIQHVRYEYYAAIPVVILSALAIGTVVTWAYDLFVVQKAKEGEQKPEVTTAKKNKPSKRMAKEPYDPMRNSKKFLCGSILFALVAMGSLFFVTSLATDYTLASGHYVQMNGDWKASMEWLQNNTPETGVDYYTIYDSRTFKYPDSAYGVMSWWDYGHLITYIGKRIPNANPFQAGVQGANGSAAYFINTDESVSNTIADNIKIKYVVTDIEMDTGKFWAMATWFNESVAGMPYQSVFVMEQSLGNIQPAQLFTDQYYQTMVSKLHNFDGSMREPGMVTYIEYVDPSQQTGYSYPLILRGGNGDYANLSMAMEKYNANADIGYHAALVGTTPVQNPTPVPALRHYRLVYESPSVAWGDLHYVKIFEYVKGKDVPGEGVVEVKIRTNTGREFVYQQESVNGTFTLPYSTTGSRYDTKAVTPYHIVGTNTTFDVSESEVA
jgi:dolichyl-diphosphooligosaccharide--protein glycosyltransferase